MRWSIGRCAFDLPKRTIDVRRLKGSHDSRHYLERDELAGLKALSYTQARRGRLRGALEINMKLLNLASVVTAVALLSVSPIRAAEAAEAAKAMLKDANGQNAGSVSFTQTPAGVLLRLSLKDVPRGEHAFHIHAAGKCEPPNFASAGGHFNPAGAHHGMMSGPGHAGDMPNLHVPDSGALDLEMLNVAITLDKDKPNSVFQPGGTAAIIHAGKDDYTNDPAGNAGDRIICGVIGE
jgi:superoxide dismutase, Cu-Zn family